MTTRYTIQSVQHNPGPCHPNTFYYSDSDESDDDEPSEMIKDQKLIHHLSGSPTPSSDHVVASLSLLPSSSPQPRIVIHIGGERHTLPQHDSTYQVTMMKYSSPPPHELNNEIFNPEGDILILENLLKDDPSEVKNSEIDSLIKGPSDTFLIGDEDIKLNPPMDVDTLVLIPRVSEKLLDSFDLILETSKMTITDPLFDFDSEFTYIQTTLFCFDVVIKIGLKTLPGVLDELERSWYGGSLKSRGHWWLDNFGKNDTSHKLHKLARSPLREQGAGFWVFLIENPMLNHNLKPQQHRMETAGVEELVLTLETMALLRD
ncbi:hypothetical protein Tco_1524402 [Tanacetum coccineum]